MANGYPGRYDDDEIIKRLIQRERRCQILRDSAMEGLAVYLPGAIVMTVAIVVVVIVAWAIGVVR